MVFIDLAIHVTVMRLSMLAPTLPHPGQGVAFPYVKWQACPRGRVIELLKCACETRSACPVKFPVIPRVRGRDLNSNVARWVGQLNSN